MDEANLIGKTKTDLLAIVELTGVLPMAEARKLKKADLVQALLAADAAAGSGAKAGSEQATKAEAAATKAAKEASPKTTAKRGRPSKKAQATAAKTEPQSAADQGERVEQPKLERKAPKQAAAPETTATETTVTEATAEQADGKQGASAAAKKGMEKKAPERKRAEKKQASKKTAESKTTEHRVAEQKVGEQQAVEKKLEAHEGKATAKTDKPADAQGANEKAQQSSKGEVKETQIPKTENRKNKNDKNLKGKHRHELKVPEIKRNAHEAAASRDEENEGETPNFSEENMVTGVLEIMPENYGFLRLDNYLQSPNDIYLPPQYIRRFGLRTGDLVTGPCRQKTDKDRYRALYYIKSVNGMSPDKMLHRPHFGRLTPIYPDCRYVLETSRNELSTRIIDLMAPIGKGQRGMIVSPPKAGKTILLQKIANAISTNNPQAKLIVLLIDERPEEVTDMQRSIKGEVVYSTFDKTPENHVRITELVLERAERLVELGEDVIILLDSITRMGRAYNLTINPTGRTLSGGLDPGALYGPKRFFGAARNIEGGGSLTILATALIDTGSRMDEVIFEEFKGTGNMEVYLDRKLSEKRIFPAIDITRSGTRREELLLGQQELDAVWSIRKAFGSLDTAAVTETIINLMLKTRNNEQFIASINVSFNDKSYFEAMRGTSVTNNKDHYGSGNGNGNSNN